MSVAIEDILKRYHKDALWFLQEHEEFTTREYFEFCNRRWGVSKSTVQRWLREKIEEGVLVKVGRGRYRISDEVKRFLKGA